MSAVNSYDIVGNIAIVEIPEGADEKKIAKHIIENNKNVKTVVKKVTGRTGTYRLNGLEAIAGDNNLETVHKEHGLTYRLNIGKVYFSTREGEERQRISGKIGRNETILLMFAGIGAYAITIVKKRPDAKVYAVEINGDAYDYMKTNIRLNRVDNAVYPLKGDVKDVCKNMVEKFDRVIMPSPSNAHEFLNIAISSLKRGGWIHFYTTSKEGEEDYAKEILEKEAKKLGRIVAGPESRKVLPYAPRIWKRCVEARIL